ncbi:class I SAM-dependent methyltransferase [Denitrobaculum tricleocarpae]|uniref:Methyltransferase domain-containing protein n=1 Tax=Denitrobaculum tricleocarpae TaxID=2591009 RepID=A0A545TGE5_9PROT|nr:class I SAM-dependent methyltransferase [Denitrobaculum tricleocarpae]TQV76314.1 methyltransferase domain-containing protein [Denitrobaculum tricleocarpae]
MANRQDRRTVTKSHMDKGAQALRRGDPREAAVWFGKAVVSEPKNASAHHNLSCALADSGALDLAIVSSCRALELNPKHDNAVKRLGSILKTPGLTLNRLPAPKGLLVAFGVADTDHTTLGPLAAQMIRQNSALTPAFELMEQESADAAAEWLCSKAGLKALGEPLLIALLTKTINRDLVVEKLLTALRRRCLLDRPVSELPPTPLQRVLAALAIQGAINEFVFATSAEEDRTLDCLQRDVETQLSEGGRIGGEALLYALYRPLKDLSAAGKLLEINPKKLPEPLRRVVEFTLRQDQEEATLKADLKRLRPIDAAGSTHVAAMYEENPYPRWLSMDIPVEGSWTRQLRETVGELASGLADTPENVLVAGCGTGRHALYCAFGYAPQNETLAIDLSTASLGYAMRKTKSFNARKLSFLQADILDLDLLGREFDIIESVGVLHHMADPMAGWRKLCARLKPGGVMRIGLYRDLGRQDILAGRAYVRDKKLTADPDGIRRFRQALIRDDAELADQTWRDSLMATPDFYSASEVRDLVFHVQERNYTLPEIGESLKELGLLFGGLEGPRSLKTAFRQKHPDPGAPQDLEAWWAFEQQHPELFRRMYEFWCIKPTD